MGVGYQQNLDHSKFRKILVIVYLKYWLNLMACMFFFVFF